MWPVVLLVDNPRRKHVTCASHSVTGEFRGKLSYPRPHLNLKDRTRCDLTMSSSVILYSICVCVGAWDSYRRVGHWHTVAMGRSRFPGLSEQEQVKFVRLFLYQGSPLIQGTQISCQNSYFENVLLKQAGQLKFTHRYIRPIIRATVDYSFKKTVCQNFYSVFFSFLCW
jgi:hypothetical protein